MKVIIDIDEEIYQEAVKKGYAYLYDEKVAYAVANSIPLNDVLDKIRAEIASYGTNSGMLLALEIIDKYRK